MVLTKKKKKKEITYKDYRHILTEANPPLTEAETASDRSDRSLTTDPNRVPIHACRNGWMTWLEVLGSSGQSEGSSW